MPTLSNPSEFQSALRQLIEDRIPFCSLLGFKLKSLDPQRPEMVFAMRDEMIGNFSHGMLHGGVISSALDTVAGLAVMLKMGHEKPQATAMAQSLEFARISTLDLRVDYLKPGRGKSFLASAVVIRLGTRVANVQMMLHNDEGSCIATGAAAFMLHAIRSDA